MKPLTASYCLLIALVPRSGAWAAAPQSPSPADSPAPRKVVAVGISTGFPFPISVGAYATWFASRHGDVVARATLSGFPFIATQLKQSLGVRVRPFGGSLILGTALARERQFFQSPRGTFDSVGLEASLGNAWAFGFIDLSCDWIGVYRGIWIRERPYYRTEENGPAIYPERGAIDSLYVGRASVGVAF